MFNPLSVVGQLGTLAPQKVVCDELFERDSERDRPKIESNPVFLLFTTPSQLLFFFIWVYCFKVMNLFTVFFFTLP